MSRAELTDPVLQPAPNFLRGVDGAVVQVNVRDGGPATVYQNPDGEDTWTNPLTTRSGRIEPVEQANAEAWLETGSYDLLVTFDSQSYLSRLEAVNAEASGTPTPPARQTATITTGTLANTGAWATGTVTLATGFDVLRVATDRPARVRLYTRPTLRDADSLRAVGTDPTGNHGCILEVVTITGMLTLDMAPVAHAYSMETVPSANIAYVIENRDTGPAAVTATIVWRAQE